MVGYSRNKQSPVLRRFFRASLGFGILMGMVFPFYALVFARFDSLPSFMFFSAGCVMAGIIVGLGSWLIGKKLILDWLENRSHGLGMLGKEGAVLDINLSRQLGDLSENFTGFFMALDTLLGRLRETGVDAEGGMARLSAVLVTMKQQLETVETESGEGRKALGILTQKLEDVSREGIRLSSAGSRILEGMDEEQSTFLQLDDCGAGLRRTQEALSVNIATGLARGQLMGKTIESGKLAFQSLKDMQDRLDLVTSILVNLSTTLEDTAAKSSLLAMNTAIEAARAGEFGRGFSVIAKEMGVQSAQTRDYAEKLVRDLQSLRLDLDNGKNAIGLADQVFRELQTNTDENLGAMAELDRFAEQLLHNGKSLDDNLSRFRQLILGLKPLALDFADSNQRFSSLADTGESRQAGARLSKLLNELKDLKESREDMIAGLAELRTTIASIGSEMKQFRLLDEADP